MSTASFLQYVETKLLYEPDLRLACSGQVAHCMASDVTGYGEKNNCQFIRRDWNPEVISLQT